MENSQTGEKEKSLVQGFAPKAKTAAGYVPKWHAPLNCTRKSWGTGVQTRNFHQFLGHTPESLSKSQVTSCKHVHSFRVSGWGPKPGCQSSSRDETFGLSHVHGQSKSIKILDSRPLSSSAPSPPFFGLSPVETRGGLCFRLSIYSLQPK